MRNRLLAGAATLALAAGGALAVAGVASAAPNCGTDASCNETPSVTVQASITESIDNTAFSFGTVQAGEQVGPQFGVGGEYTGAPGSAAPSVGTPADYTITTMTGDGAGYSVTGEGSDFTTGTQTIPLANLAVYTALAGGTWGPAKTLPTSGTPATIASSATNSGGSGDPWWVSDTLNVPGSLGNGHFTATITYVSVAN